MSRLNDLIRQLQQSNPALADDIRREVAALADRRSFGLNFERHVPEAVELPGRKVRTGDKVRVLPPRGTTTGADERLWLVTSIARAKQGARVAELSLLPDHDETSTCAVEDLIVVAEFRDPIYPGLLSTGRLEYGGDSPFHCIINAENYHALQTLLFTHRGKVDCIYIDPPYNTGNDDWIYSDRYVNGDDLYRHSKWLAFMERRLELARELLKDTGVIVVAIGDDQHHRLRMLLDQVFGDQNFLANVTWQGSGKNDARYTAGGVDYMLMYARDEVALTATETRWRETKPGLDLAIAAGEKAWSEADGDAGTATRLYRAALRSLRGSLEPAVFRYDQIDTHGRIFQADNIMSPTPRPNLQYDLPHPTTGKPCRMHPNGWRYSKDLMADRIRRDAILFGPDERTSPRLKRFLTDQSEQVPYPSFTQARMPGSKRVEGLLGDSRFPFPKDDQVLARWISIVAGPSAIILDFFGGSGSTVEAVTRLNHQDGGTRQCILVTNNEVGIKEARTLAKAGHRHGDSDWETKGVHNYVTRPRITSAVTGVRPDGSTHDKTVAANVEFLTLTYESPLRVQSHREFERIAPLLWMRAGSVGRRIDALSDGWAVADTYGVLSDLDQADKFVTALGEQADARIAFIVTDEDRLFESVVRDLPEHVEPVRLYEAYLRNFEIESGRGAR
ncbi:site-specific DNA-methyltransferase [Blastococcus sp. BMG 814]|uniref:Site-specific DNA-methyltransferase n=1 Tax=Blastococcus carthaginiensis TaxID=3050034 RepID=A0ABT9IGW3_9ACTN|nr:site-specific DNA-methyltransferase [Blastococcus carthaginiensis]MDP5184389.1 site-specific DNA-methyltransferase [Blastococcus carthaginiensis]